MIALNLLSKQIVARALIVVFLLITLPLALIVLYSMQQTVPRGVFIENWAVQGMPISQLQVQLSDHLQRLQHQQVLLRSSRPGIPSGTFTWEQLGFSADMDRVWSEFEALQLGSFIERAKHRWRMRNHSYRLHIDFDTNQLEHAVAMQWDDIISGQPADARRTITPDDRVLYIPDKPAYRIDILHLRERLTRLFPTPWWTLTLPPPRLMAELPVREVAATITLQSLKEEGIERKIAQFTTQYRSSSEGRKHNIQSTARIIHDQILKPNEIFDYNKVIRETKAQYGFKAAPVIFNGTIVPGIGGGICQVSTTLYNAVLRTGLEIVERRNHSLPIGYVPKGQDATFAEGYINFRFRNSSGAHLLIRTVTTDWTITVKLFGTLPKDITYTIESNTVKTLQPPVKYVKNNTLPRGQQKLIAKGRIGHIVETYRYKKENGRIIAKELISKDTYKPQPTIFAVNREGSARGDRQPADPIAPKRSILEDGVSGPVF